MNKHQIIGRFGQDPELRYTKNNTAVLNSTVATTERYKDRDGNRQEKTEWHRVVAWGRVAEVIAEYFSKGDRIFIEGPSETREWEDSEGNKRYSTEIRVKEFEFIDGGKRNESDSQGSTAAAPAPAKNKEQVDLTDDVDDDLPF